MGGSTYNLHLPKSSSPKPCGDAAKSPFAHKGVTAGRVVRSSLVVRGGIRREGLHKYSSPNYSRGDAANSSFAHKGVTTWRRFSPPAESGGRGRFNVPFMHRHALPRRRVRYIQKGFETNQLETLIDYESISAQNCIVNKFWHN